jgi:hypothetical protein
MAMWLPLFWRHRGEWFPLKPQGWRIDGDVPLANALAAWTEIARRHEVLRSSFAVTTTGQVVQRVTHPDHFTAPVTCAPLSEYEAFVAADHDLDFDGPLWSVTVFHENGMARGACLLAEHVLYDVAGLRNWREQLDRLLADAGDHVDVARHPIDMANAEPSAGHARVRQARDRYGESLSRGAQVLIPATRQAGPDRYLRSTATYAGLAATVDAIAHRCHGTRPSVLTYAVGWLFARLSRHRSLPVDLLYANRSPREQTIGCQMEHVFFDVGFDDRPPAVGVKELARTTIGAFARGRMPRNTAAAVRATVSAARGTDIKEPVMVNVLSGSDTRFDIDRDTGNGAVVHEWSGGGTPFTTMIVIVGYDEDVEITLEVDGAMVTREDTTAVLEDLPRVLAHLHDHPDRALTDHDGWRTTPFPLDDGLTRVGPDWVRPRKVAAMIAAIPGVHTAEVTIEDEVLTATVDCDDTLSYFDLHEHLLAATPDHTDVVAPARYRASPSGIPWHVEDRAPIPPATTAERVLHGAIRRTHGFSADDFGRTYVTAGGDLDLVPALVLHVEAAGYSGLTSTMFTAPFTLRRIAGALTRQS